MRYQVLVLCTGNTARTHMAEGLFRELAPQQIEAVSAGLQATLVHPLAIRAMAERGIDIRHHRSKSYDAFLQRPFDYVITVCDKAAEACPTFPGRGHRLHWSLPDPLAAIGTDEEKLQAFRDTRDAIEHAIRGWLLTLDAEPVPSVARAEQ